MPGLGRRDLQAAVVVDLQGAVAVPRVFDGLVVRGDPHVGGGRGWQAGVAGEQEGLAHHHGEGHRVRVFGACRAVLEHVAVFEELDQGPGHVVRHLAGVFLKEILHRAETSLLPALEHQVERAAAPDRVVVQVQAVPDVFGQSCQLFHGDAAQAVGGEVQRAEAVVSQPLH